MITSLVENIGVPESQSLNLTSKEDDRKGKQMQSDYCATYFGKKITIHHPDFDQVCNLYLKKIKLAYVILYIFVFIFHRVSNILPQVSSP